jgi:hypothetical protein
MRFYTLGLFFINQPPQGPWFTDWSRFAYGFEFAEKFNLEIAKIGFRGLNETAEADFFAGVPL